MQVAFKYKGSNTAQNSLVKKIANGGSGVWGDAMMPPHSTMPNSEISTIVKYILSLSNKQTTQKSLPVTGSYVTKVPANATNKGSFIFRAAYKDRGANSAPAQFSEAIVVLKNPTTLVDHADRSHELAFNNDRSMVTANKAGAYLLMSDIDLSTLKSIVFTPGDQSASGTIEVRIGAVDGKLIGMASLKEGASNFTNLVSTTGKQNLYLVFTEAGLKLKDFTFRNQ